MKRTIGKKMAVAAGLILSLTMATGMAFAQRPGRGGGFGTGGGFGAGMGGRGGMLGPMMATALGLTDAQKTQIQDIRSAAREANTALREQIKQARAQEIAAVKAGKSDAELQSLAQSTAPLLAQMHASQLVAHAKVYKVLTPEQRAKLETFRSEMKERVGNRANRFRRGQVN